MTIQPATSAATALPPAIHRSAAPDPIARQLDALIENKRVVVFTGYSGLGYADLATLDQEMEDVIRHEADTHGMHNLLIVAGATPEGIGRVYEVADRLGAATLGIVSAAVGNAPTAAQCRTVVKVPDAEGTWQVLNARGGSYMVDVARHNGVLHAFGGGKVTVSEAREALARNIEVVAHPEFEPDPGQLARREARDPHFEATPFRNWMAGR